MIQPGKFQTVDIAKSRLLRRPALQNIERYLDLWKARACGKQLLRGSQVRYGREKHDYLGLSPKAEIAVADRNALCNVSYWVHSGHW
jgi:hypothetical protein